MAVDKNPFDENSREKNMGTKNLNEILKPIKGNTNPKSIQEAFHEFNEFKEIKRRDDLISNPSPGTPAYLISSNWLKKYHKYILFDEFTKGYSGKKELIHSEDYF